MKCRILFSAKNFTPYVKRYLSQVSEIVRIYAMKMKLELTIFHSSLIYAFHINFV